MSIKEIFTRSAGFIATTVLASAPLAALSAAASNMQEPGAALFLGLGAAAATAFGVYDAYKSFTDKPMSFGSASSDDIYYLSMDMG